MINGYGKKSVSRNILTELQSGKPQKQAVASALSTASKVRQARGRQKKGGTCTPDNI